MEKNVGLLTKKYVDMIDDELNGYIIQTGEPYDVIKEAMLYAINAGGKRIRPIFTIEFCKLNGGNVHVALPFACAVEMIHAYSLIHDDLPCMDNDDMRRGLPSCHKKFGEAIALLAGDALLTQAFEIMAQAGVNGLVPAERCVEAIKVLAMFAGADGMAGGQTLDVINEGTSISEEMLNLTHLKKTSALIKAACRLGAIAAGAGKDAIEKCQQFGHYFGLAFQIVDDILDVSGDEAVLGKPKGSDADNHKTTYMSFYDKNTAKNIATRNQDTAVEILKQFKDSEYLQDVIAKVLDR